MTCHCAHTGLADVFGERTARMEARRFRRRGLPDRANRLIEAIRRAVPLHEAVALEGGAGVGGLSIELLRRGLTRAVAVDAIPAFARMARRLAEDYGVASRLELQVADFAELDDDAEYDIVVLDRVVCCYPDWRALLQVATSHATGVVALTYPRAAWWTRAAAGATNAGMWAARKRFRLHIHDPAEMHAMLRRAGFEPDVVGRVGTWELCVAPRAGPT